MILGVMGGGPVSSPMNAVRQGPLRTVMIPWVMALWVWVGWNALIPDHGRSRNDDALEGAGLSQVADETGLPGRVADPLVFTPVCDGTLGLEPKLSWHLLPIPMDGTQVLTAAPEGACRGRAPPSA